MNDGSCTGFQNVVDVHIDESQLRAAIRFRRAMLTALVKTSLRLRMTLVIIVVVLVY